MMNNPTRAPVIVLGEIRPIAAGASALPLESTRLTGQIRGLLASISVAQRFTNPLQEPAELEYLFPLPHQAAVTGFELRVGSRVTAGKLEEIQKAQAVFEAARDLGQRAGLLEQRRPNLFSVRLANVLPGERIEAVLRYQDRVQFNADTFEFVFPMGITPKYNSPVHPGEAAGVGVTLAAPDERIGPVEIDLSVDAGLPVGDPSSPSHPLAVERLDERRFQVSLRGEHIPDHDFVLRYPARASRVEPAAWTTPGEEGEIFLAALFPPAAEETFQPRPREFIFVLDRSGSMSGEPIAQARNALRACLRSLNPGDTFRILLFNDHLEWYQRSASPVEQGEIDKADRFLSRVEGGGGTEIVGAVEAALEVPPDPERPRYVVFLTDGAVSAEQRALDQVRRKLGKSRLFTFGIGPSVNRALLSRMASLGRGAAEFLQLDEDIEGAIIRFQDRLAFPVLTDLTLDWDGARGWDGYPALLPDLYAGQPLELCGRFKRQGGTPPVLKIHGLREGRPVDLDLALPAPQEEVLVGRAWARARVDDLLEQAAIEPKKSETLRSQVISLAIDYGLVTPYTAFVAVEKDVANPGGKQRHVPIAQPVPEGLRREPFGGGTLHAAMWMPSVPARFGKASAPSLGARLSKSAWDGFTTGAPASGAAAFPDRPASTDRPALLRWLARTQSLDGSWDQHAERTAVALLAFVRAGQTTRAGSYRVAVRRAVEWLEKVDLTGLPALVRALAFHELAHATGLESHLALAGQALHALPHPVEFVQGPHGWVIRSLPLEDQGLDSLRLAVLTGSQYQPASAPRDDLSLTWAAALAG
ncbi:MAG TPA: VIT domain-containing protein [Anaerolineaceae bacterium]|nr:VIT domain-containing protein [Anaerolineaceae bacterium]